MAPGVLLYSVRYKEAGSRVSNNGYFSVDLGQSYVWLFDRRRQTKSKGQIGLDVLKTFKKGSCERLTLNGFEIQILQEIKPGASSKEEGGCGSSHSSSNAKKRPRVDTVEVGSDNAENRQRHYTTNILQPMGAAKASVPPTRAAQDDAKPVLRAHQKTAVDFLLRRLSSTSSSGEGSSSVVGAVLADDMGMGKSLTCLSVVDALTAKGAGKAIVVCPATLINNWCDETVKWFPKSLGKSVVSVENAQANESVRRFVQGHALLYPLLIISYDMYRNFSNVLNAMTTVQLMACDEGHRLKNAYGTKTMDALTESTCPRRLLLTGTPIQNNLLELFAMVDFVHPGFLGSAQSFREEYIVPIEANKVAGAIAHEKLSQTLRHVLIRRTRDAAMKSVLPPCITMRVQCAFTPRQAVAYLQESEAVLRHGGGGDILPAIMRLRGVCCDASADRSDAADGADARGVSPLAWHEMTSTKLYFVSRLLESIFDKPGSVMSSVAGSDGDAGTDRVVIVSNFIAALDAVQALIRERNWLHFRIDGSTAVELRQSIVHKFNAPRSPFKVVLLSTKAGGVGLNLVGANRLVMLDPDWNPSTDHQAMGRVWRDGQTKPVFIYRIACVGSVEESILARQRAKGDLLSLVEKACEDGTATRPESCSEEEKSECGGKGKKGMAKAAGTGSDLSKLHGEGLEQLVRPGGAALSPLEAFRIVTEVTSTADSPVDPVLDGLRLKGRVVA